MSFLGALEMIGLILVCMVLPSALALYFSIPPIRDIESHKFNHR